MATRSWNLHRGWATATSILKEGAARCPKSAGERLSPTPKKRWKVLETKGPPRRAQWLPKTHSPGNSKEVPQPSLSSLWLLPRQTALTRWLWEKKRWRQSSHLWSQLGVPSCAHQVNWRSPSPEYHNSEKLLLKHPKRKILVENLKDNLY